MKPSLITICAFILSFIPLAVFAQGLGNSWNQAYEPMVNIPGITPNQDTTFASYVNALYAVAIVVAAIIAVIKLVLAGAKYMMTDVVTSKGQAIEDIKGALLGLLIILTAFLVLRTINPQLTNIDVLPDERLTLVGSDLTEFAIMGGFTPQCSGDNCRTIDCPDYIENAAGVGECATWCGTLNGIHTNNTTILPDMGPIGGGADECFVDPNLIPPGTIVPGTSNTFQCPESVYNAATLYSTVVYATGDEYCTAWCSAQNGTFTDTYTGGGTCTYGPERPVQTTTYDCEQVMDAASGLFSNDCTAGISACRTLPSGNSTIIGSQVQCTHF